MLYHYNANLHIVLFDNRQRDKSEFVVDVGVNNHESECGEEM